MPVRRFRRAHRELSAISSAPGPGIQGAALCAAAIGKLTKREKHVRQEALHAPLAHRSRMFELALFSRVSWTLLCHVTYLSWRFVRQYWHVGGSAAPNV